MKAMNLIQVGTNAWALYGRSPAVSRGQGSDVSLGPFDKSRKFCSKKPCGCRHCEQQENSFTIQGTLLPEMRAARDGEISSVSFTP